MNKTQLQKTKKKKLTREQNGSNREIKRNERRQKRENVAEEDIDLGSFFELATTSRKYVNGLNLHEIKNEILEDYTVDFELIGSMLLGEINCFYRVVV